MNKTEWSDFEREDLKMLVEMEEAGWLVIFSMTDKVHGRLIPSNPPHDPVSFQKENVRIWKARHGDKIKWRTADLIHGHFENHGWHASLEDVLKSRNP